MNLRGRVACFICATSLLASGASARADDLQGRAAAQARCEATYGPGFSPVDGSDACIWVGGHIRVGFGPRGASPDNGWANGGAKGATLRVNAGDGVEPRAGHLRLRDGDSTGAIAR